MTFQEVERAIQFMLENQARFDAGMHQMNEQQQKTQATLDRVAIQHAALDDVVLKLAQSHIELVNSHKELTEAGKRTEERLDAFILFVEKYISSRNGGEQTH